MSLFEISSRLSHLLWRFLMVLCVAVLPGTAFTAAVEHASCVEGAWGSETRCAGSSWKGSSSHDVLMSWWSGSHVNPMFLVEHNQKISEVCHHLPGKRRTALQSLGGLPYTRIRLGVWSGKLDGLGDRLTHHERYNPKARESTWPTMTLACLHQECRIWRTWRAEKTCKPCRLGPGLFRHLGIDAGSFILSFCCHS